MDTRCELLPSDDSRTGGTGKKRQSRSGAEVIAKVLKMAEPRPTIKDKQGDKIK